jgi:hypothetical protein
VWAGCHAIPHPLESLAVYKIVQEVTLYYKTLPLSGRVLAQSAIIIVMLNMAIKFGEAVGRALYYFMH